jgi:hypothetical protein
MENYIQNGGGSGYSYPIQNLLKSSNNDPNIIKGGGTNEYKSYEHLAIPMGLIHVSNHDLKSWKRGDVAEFIDAGKFDAMFSSINGGGHAKRNVSKNNRAHHNNNYTKKHS